MPYNTLYTRRHWSMGLSSPHPGRVGEDEALRYFISWKKKEA